MEKYKIELHDCEYWEALPNPWKAVKRVSKAPDFKGVKDPKLLSIIKPYITTDGTNRPEIYGLNINDGGIFMTNAHSFLVYPLVAGNEIGETGIWDVSPEIAASEKRPLYSKVSDKPVHSSESFDRMIGKISRSYEVDFLKLRTYCQAAMKGGYNQKTTTTRRKNKTETITISSLTFDSGNGMKISFNPTLVIDACDTMLSYFKRYDMGHVGWVSFSEKFPVLFGADKMSVENPKLAGRSGMPFVVVMPLLLASGQDELGGENNMTGDKLKVYYSFEKNEIVNHGGSIANFDSELTDTGLEYLTEGQFDAINKICLKKSNISIIERKVAVSSGDLYVHTLDSMLQITRVPLFDGVYRIQSGALMDTDEKIENYPTRYDFEDVTNLPQVLGNPVDYAKQLLAGFDKYLSTDELRPGLMGVSYIYNEGKLYAYATNAHRAKVRHVNFSARNILETKISTLNVSNQLACLDAFNSDSYVLIHTDTGKNQKYKISELLGDVTLYGKLVSNPPDVFSIVPRRRNLRLETDYAAITEALSKGLPKKTRFVNLRFSGPIEVGGKGIISVAYKVDEDYQGAEYKTVAEIPYHFAENSSPDAITDNFVVIARQYVPDKLDADFAFLVDNLIVVLKDFGKDSAFELKDNTSKIWYSAIPDLQVTSVEMIRPKLIVEPVKPEVDKAMVEKRLNGLKKALPWLDGADREFAKSRISGLEKVLKMM
jgi:hypothetical protein